MINFKALFLTLVSFILATESVTSITNHYNPYNIDNRIVTVSNTFSSIIFLTGTFVYSSLSNQNPLSPRSLDPSEIPFFDRIALGKTSTTQAAISDYLLYGLLTEAVMINFRDITRLRPLESPLIPTIATSTGLNLVAKSTVRRYRPYSYNPSTPDSTLNGSDAYLSFYSGHTSGAFSAAIYSSMMYQYLDYPSQYRGYIWGINITAASLTGILRISSGNHFPSDVVVGSIIGSLIGWSFPAMYNNFAEKRITALPSSAYIKNLELSAMIPSTRIISIPISF